MLHLVEVMQALLHALVLLGLMLLLLFLLSMKFPQCFWILVSHGSSCGFGKTIGLLCRNASPRRPACFLKVLKFSP